MQAGIVWAAGTAGRVVVASAITPLVQSTISVIGSLRSNTVNSVTLQDVITQHDIPCTLQTVEATCLVLQCDKEPLKTACQHVVEAVQKIHALLTRIADMTAAHEAGYISRWRTLVIDSEIEQLTTLMGVLTHRFKLLCEIRSVVE